MILSIITATVTASAADILPACAMEVSSGDSESQFETPEEEIASEPVSAEVDEVKTEVETASETQTEIVADSPREAEAPTEAETPAEVEAPAEAETPAEVEAPAEAETPAESEAQPDVQIASPVIVSAINVTGTTSPVVYDGQEHSFVVTLATEGADADGKVYSISGAEGAATVSVTAKNVSQNTFEITDLTGITVTSDGTTAVTPASLIVSADVITKRDVTLQSMNLVKTYDGNPLENGETPLADETGWVSGEGAYYTFTGSRTAIGTGINEFTIVSAKEGTDLNNYNINYIFGAITVVERLDAQKYIITVEAVSTTAKYSGKDQTVTGYVLEGRSDSEFRVNGSGDASQVLSVIIGNATFTVTGIAATATGKNAGTYSVNITGTPVIRDAEGNDVTNQFVFEFKPGKFEIEKRHVILTSASLTKKYHNKTIKKHSVTVSGDGFAEGEGATYEFTGKQKEVGQSYNYFTYKLNEGTLADNYDIEKVPGILKVKKPDDIAINETGNNNSSGNGSSNESQASNNTQTTESENNNAAGTNHVTDSSSAASSASGGNAAVLPTPASTIEGAGQADGQSVLGAKRGDVTVDIANPQKESVLGARRASTDDETNIEGHIMIFAAAIAFMAALKIKRNKRIKR
ncbi:hypothetical protein [Butyrivibrio sp. VCD2006]|uniref:hypothetical protein n=1 Tax=Butyrivibrio sp. VCD2006 TaxID=1280664 RepID=UPI001A9A632A|nr:hypothetical protein [Butyrivibrio sp. VCD2006]